MPHAADCWCIALDLIGMGSSEKLEDSGPQSYSLPEHNTYFRAALGALGIERDIVFVIHDWGSALGFLCIRPPDRVSGFYMEGIVRRFPVLTTGLKMPESSSLPQSGRRRGGA